MNYDNGFQRIMTGKKGVMYGEWNDNGRLREDD